MTKLIGQKDAAENIAPYDVELAGQLAVEIQQVKDGPLKRVSEYDQAEVDMFSEWRVSKALDGRRWWVDGA